MVDQTEELTPTTPVASDTRKTCFGVGLDTLAIKTGGWPEGAVVYAIESINAQQVLLKGDIPNGIASNGRLKWDPKGTEHKAVVSLTDYRACFRKSPS